MKLVREHINEKFSSESDPVKDMGIGKEGMFKNLEKRGVRMWFGWGDGEGQEEKKKVIENIAEITKFVDKLVEVGFDIKEMSISNHDTISVKTVEVIDSNHVIFNCATGEDARILVDTAKKFSLWEYDNFHLGKGEDMIYVNPEHHKWLDNLIENRKKYKLGK